ncbi:MAG: efflux RND transporter periplasmic adaptor subunit [Desulfomicrobium sp.]|nr:efflux RND transporter periplasmic adaptor subunit [Desulfomicrobium sp.]NLV95866.1 efflux RND transporter periplasmic adaptor subunit [Desulfovibrionales bacterium]
MKKLFIVVTALLIAVCTYFLHQQSSQAEDLVPTNPVSALEVTVLTVQEQEVSLTSELPGRTTAYQTAEIRPQVGGIIQKRTFIEGSEVKAGELLYQIDPAPYETVVARAKAAVTRSQAELEPARLKAKRYAELIRTQAVSQQDYDEVKAALGLCEANVASAQAELDAARIDLQRTKVVAPISGRIGRSSITPGALVTANQAQPLATIQQLDPIYVDLTQSNVELLRLRRAIQSGSVQSVAAKEAKASLMLEDGSTYALPGALQLAEANVDQDTGTVTLRALFPNPDRELLPGMYVRAQIEEGILTKAILVPQQSVSRDAQGQAQTLVVGPDNVLELRSLELDRAVGGNWIVRQGLQAGDQVVMDNLQKIRPGMAVRIASSTP